MTGLGIETDKQILLTRPYGPGASNTIRDLIKGIRDLDRLQALLEAEINHQQRQQVIAQLNQQKLFLQENPELTRPIEELEELDDQDKYDKPEVRYLDRDGEPYERTSADSKLREITAKAGASQ